MTQVFISHDTESDGQFARRLAMDLEQIDVDVWIAPASIRPGEQWVDAVSKGLETSTHFALVSTPRAYLSSWVRKEYNSALLLEADSEIEVVPLEVERTKIPLFLRGFQLISFREAYDTGLRQLAALLGEADKLEGVDEIPLPEPPETRPDIPQGEVLDGATFGDSPREPRVFVAYDVRDKEYATRLSRYLESHGINKWMAPGSIDPGTRWNVAIADAIVDSTAIVVIMTPNSSKSHWVQQELRVAEREAIPVFPILLAGDPFESLSKYQFVDARKGELPPVNFFERLERKLNTT